MNLDDLKQPWQERNDKLAGQHFDELAADVKSRSARFEASIRRRDWIEAAAAVFVLCGLGLFLWHNTLPPVMTLGVAVIMPQWCPGRLNCQTVSWPVSGCSRCFSLPLCRSKDHGSAII